MAPPRLSPRGARRDAPPSAAPVLTPQAVKRGDSDAVFDRSAPCTRAA